eukprot:TRINITY_DN1587_c0_g1_i1.p1 TRINITY_DN1587_c0_g1~~TRINITY_DN1587_c0_g1_i1.p1  ORF type:complete len:235 (+),score=74.02 TRINITY_DN1587_c0_g1_i1:69-707(+)
MCIRDRYQRRVHGDIKKIAVKEMKVITILVLLVVVANCNSIKNNIDAISSAYNKAIEAIEAKDKESLVKAGRKISSEIAAARLVYPYINYDRLERYGYKIMQCEILLRKLRGVSGVILENASLPGRHYRITQEKARTTALINRTLEACIIADDSVARNLQANGEKAECKEAMRKYKEKLEEYKKNPEIALNSQKGTLLFDALVACGTKRTVA